MANRRRTVAVTATWFRYRWLVALAVAIAALTAVQVSALWKAPSEMTPAITGGGLWSDAEKIADKIERRLHHNPADLEASLLQALLHFREGNLPRALSLLEQLTRRAPNFHLAHLVRGDLLLAQFRPLTGIGNNGVMNGLGLTTSEPVDRLREEAQARLQGYLALLDSTQVPSVLINLAGEVTSAVVIDKSRNRLYLFENPGSDRPPRLLGDYYSVFGKAPGNKQERGDMRTPEGVYFVVGHIPGEKLPNRYGTQAFPLNYPNEFDLRFGKTGSGIWVHGTDRDYYSRPPQDSDGCVVLTNDDLQTLGGYLHPGVTPVIIADHLEWVSPTEWRSRREELVTAVEGWRRDWETDIDRFLTHYSTDFLAPGSDLADWRRRKLQLARGQENRQVNLQRLSLYGYPTAASSSRTLVVADFHQSYRAGNFSSEMDKRLYLVQENRSWRVWYEGGR
ncbi:MAG: L,D-transpeptidase family protein [Desulfuromonadales bacterium]|nr:L,D-transpeptidase family protein [Desulfuromonadales bacterium]